MSYSDIIDDSFRSARVSRSGMMANRARAAVYANNIANMQSVDTGKYTKDGNFIPYAPQEIVLAHNLSEDFRDNKVKKDVRNGVTVKKVVELPDQIDKVYDPDHPAARRPGTVDAGYVYYPRITLAQEMANLKMAQMGYEANLTALTVQNKMFELDLTIGRGS
jgi:flagellar basal-body rod protein FlgC